MIILWWEAWVEHLNSRPSQMAQTVARMVFQLRQDQHPRTLRGEVRRKTLQSVPISLRIRHLRSQKRRTRRPRMVKSLPRIVSKVFPTMLPRQRTQPRITGTPRKIRTKKIRKNRARILSNKKRRKKLKKMKNRQITNRIQKTRRKMLAITHPITSRMISRINPVRTKLHQSPTFLTTHPFSQKTLRTMTISSFQFLRFSAPRNSYFSLRAYTFTLSVSLAYMIFSI